LTIIQALILTVLLIVSGLADGRGFFHASRLWNDGHLQGDELVRSALWFSWGICNYWISLYWARKLGIASPLVQTLLWFTATVVGVAVASRELGSWATVDKAVALGVAAGLGVLLVRHA
jgi:hypothetical protein